MSEKKQFYMKKWLICLGVILLAFHFSFITSSCSEEEAEADEFANWEERNDAYFASLADSLKAAPSYWQRIKKFSLDPSTEGVASDYIYARIIGQGGGGECPVYTDSVRVIYQGRLIPSSNYPEGYVFDGNVFGKFSTETGYTSKFLVSKVVDGFSTALQHMHRGDYWRVFIPYQLGYGESGDGSSIPGYSTLVFDVILIDFSQAGEAMPVWSSRRSAGEMH